MKERFKDLLSIVALVGIIGLAAYGMGWRYNADDKKVN